MRVNPLTTFPFGDRAGFAPTASMDFDINETISFFNNLG
jgi:hypothetical protein